jgi:subtilisin family serine protease
VAHASSAGSLVVASAGNRGTSSSTQDGLRFPAAFDDVLGVAASDASSHVSDDSIHGAQVDILAPGMQVLATVVSGADCVFATDAASTSYATAYASGVAALVAGAHPEETPAQWMQRIEATGNRPNPDSRDDKRGWGMISPYDAINVHVIDGLRGPRSDYTAPYDDQLSRSAQPITTSETADPNGLTKRIVVIVGFALIVLVIIMLSISYARTLAKRSEQSPTSNDSQ